MNQKEILIQEINELPDFIIEFEYLAKEDNEFYQSDEFKNIVAESISEYRQGKAEDMDLFK